MVEVHYVSTPDYNFKVFILMNPQVSYQRDMLSQDYTVNSIENFFYKNPVNSKASNSSHCYSIFETQKYYENKVMTYTC